MSEMQLTEHPGASANHPHGAPDPDWIAPNGSCALCARMWAEGLQRELTAARAEIETLRRDAIPESYWLVRSLGGEGPPMHAFCRNTEEVRRAIGALIWGGDYEHAEIEELDQYMTHFADPDNWGSEGTHWIIQFEIDGIEAILLDKHAAIDAVQSGGKPE